MSWAWCVKHYLSAPPRSHLCAPTLAGAWCSFCARLALGPCHPHAALPAHPHHHRYSVALGLAVRGAGDHSPALCGWPPPLTRHGAASWRRAHGAASDRGRQRGGGRRRDGPALPPAARHHDGGAGGGGGGRQRCVPLHSVHPPCVYADSGPGGQSLPPRAHPTTAPLFAGTPSDTDFSEVGEAADTEVVFVREGVCVCPTRSERIQGRLR